MVDDIDDLLDEVESKFCNNDTKKTRPKLAKDIKKSYTQPVPTDDLDNIIDDIIADDGLDAILKRNVTKTSSMKISDGTNSCKDTCTRTKCFTVFVGGTNSLFGVATSSSKRSCDQLHCTSCDNKIVTFADFKWTDCDYLDFRNNYPDFVRLKSKLLPRKGYRAYCCQCSWLAVNDLDDLKKVNPNLKWFCRKH